MSLEEFKKRTGQVQTLTISEIPVLEDLVGNVVLIVNTASLCGFTRQYADLESLYKKYKEHGLRVFAYPSNDFGNQEPGSHTEILNFCQTNYNISFPILPKSAVTGEYINPLYKKISEAVGQVPKWNFHKYLISKDGKTIISLDHFTEIDSTFEEMVKEFLEK